MSASTYDEALRRLLAHEGGYVNHPSDPGGPTNFGITLADYRRYRKPDATVADVRAMKVDEAKAIYRAKYWNAQRCDELPAGVDYSIFDYGVNSGVGRSGKVLRRVVGLSDAREGAGLFYDQKADVKGISHAVDRYLALVSVLGISTTASPLEWPLPAGGAPAGFQETSPYILLHPFSRGAGKSLSTADVAAFCHAVAPMRVVLAGRSEEAVPALDHVENLLNRTTLAELAWLIRRAAFVVSVDSGPMHIAAALTPRLLSIHTWSDPAKVGPYRPEAWVWKDGALFQQGEPTTSQRPAKDIGEVAQFVRAQV